MTRKRIACCFIILFLLPVCVHAHWSAGFQLDGVIAQHWSPYPVDEDVTVEAGIRLAAASALGLSYSWNPRLHLQFQLRLIQKGAHHRVFTEGFPFGWMDLTYAYDYLEFPLVLRTYWKTGKWGFYSFGGIYTALLVKTSYTFKNDHFPTSTRSVQMKEKWDAGVSFGFGLDLSIRRLTMVLEYRYSMGFVDMHLPTEPEEMDDAIRHYFPNILLRNMTQSIGFGLRFPVAGRRPDTRTEKQGSP